MLVLTVNGIHRDTTINIHPQFCPFPSHLSFSFGKEGSAIWNPSIKKKQLENALRRFTFTKKKKKAKAKERGDVPWTIPSGSFSLIHSAIVKCQLLRCIHLSRFLFWWILRFCRQIRVLLILSMLKDASSEVLVLWYYNSIPIFFCCGLLDISDFAHSNT